MKASYNSNIQALRAIAALMVFLSHSLMMIKSDTINSIYETPFHLFFDGQIAVVFFMVLSGFFYYKIERLTIKKFFGHVKKKVLRIYPIHIIMIIIGVFLCNLQLKYCSELFSDWSNSFWTYPIGWKETLRQFVIIIPGTDSYLVNSPVWYLVVEVRMFIVMPLIAGTLFYIKEKYKELPFYLIWFVFCLAALILYPFALSYLIGYLAAHLFRTNELLRDNNSVFLLIGGGISALLMLNIRNELLINVNGLSLFVQSIGASILILISFISVTPVNRFLSWLGNYSYEFYLAHFVVLLFCKTLVNNVILWWFLSLFLTALLTYILHEIQKCCNNLVYHD